MERHLSQSENVGGYISSIMQLGMTLRFYVGVTYLDIYDRYDVNSSSFYSLVFEFLELIVDEYPIVFPTDQSDLKELTQGFQK